MILFKSVRFKNILSFGNIWTEVDLLRARKTIIVGTNGHGKSSLIDVITYALFSKPFRKIPRGLLVNTINKSGLVVEIVFEIKGIKYKIIRGMSPGIFEIYINGSLHPQDASVRDYQKFLEMDILNLNYRTFTQIVVLGSDSYVQFMKLGTGAKREIIEDILDINVFSKMNDLLKPMIKEKEQKRDILKNTKELSKKQYIFMLDKSKTTAETKQNAIKSKQQEIIDIQSEILEKETTKDNTAAKKVQFESDKAVKEKKKKLEKFRFGIDKNISQSDEEIAFYDTHDTCPKCKTTLNDDFKTERIDFLTKKKIEFNEALNKLSSAMADVTAKIKKVTDAKNTNKQIAKEVQSIDYEIQTLKHRINFLKSSIKEIEDEQTDIVTPAELEAIKKKVQEADQDLMKKHHEVRIMKMCIGILKDTGAKTAIIRFYLPLINKTINHFLELFDFNILFMFDENFDEDIKARNIDTFRYANFSAGERMRIDLSLMFTWREIAKKKNSASTNLLFFDEVLDGSLDADGLANFLRIIEEFDADANLYVISHRPGMEIGFDSILQVKKENNFSNYQYQ